MSFEPRLETKKVGWCRNHHTEMRSDDRCCMSLSANLTSECELTFAIVTWVGGFH